MFDFQLTHQSIDVDLHKKAFIDNHCGAFVTFEGWVRNHNEGKSVTGLEYSAYESMAVKIGRDITEKIYQQHSLSGLFCIHRLGRLELGDMAVWVGASSAHREAAFAACKALIDDIKQDVPIWKKESYLNGDSGQWLE